MTARDLLGEIVCIQPGFRAYWDGENYFQGGEDAFSACGVFCSFTHYFRSGHKRMAVAEIQAIAALIGRCENDATLRTAAYTCFLENIAGEAADQSIAPFLSRNAQEFMDRWRPGDA
ncbi:MAG: hypothetical protein HYV96_19800 [Opitutae bacterium]|nr:hypothetical protein [Opitutae bacterium]